MKKIVQVFLTIALFALIAGCSKEITSSENYAPVLVRILTDISVPVDGYVTVTFKHIEAYDDNGDKMTIVIHKGENYTVDGATVTPTKGFIGDLSVPIQVSDGLLLSKTDVITISVVKEVVSLPLFTGAWWEYNDTIAGDSKVLTSRMEVSEEVTRTINGQEITAFDVMWTNLDEYGVIYLMSNDTDGSIIYGGISSNDTLINEQRFYKFPVKMGDSWAYTPLKYNATDSVFITNSEATTISCTNPSVYVQVPAGTFHCAELTTSYSMDLNQSSKTANVLFGTESESTSSQTVTITEKIYYAAGVGTVQTTILADGVQVWNKVLRDYYVIEETN